MATAPGVIEAGVLPHQEILRLCGLQGNNDKESSDVGPIQPCNRANVRSASYDLRLGADYHSATSSSNRGYVGGMQVVTLTPGRDEHIVIPPNQVVVVSSYEKVCLPNDMIGHLTLKQDILLQGLIMASQSQIDAGYRGWIYPLFYNLTDRPVTLHLKQSIIRLELVRLEQPTEAPYGGDYQEKKLSESLKSPFGSSLTALREEIEERGRQLRNTRWAASIAAVAAIALPIGWGYASGFVGEARDASAGVARLEGEMESVKLDNELKQLKKRVAELQCERSQENRDAARNRC